MDWTDWRSQLYQENLLLHCCLFWEHFSWRFSHVFSWLGDRYQSLLLVITRTEFISALVITNECLQYLRGLTTSLQEEAKDSSGSVWDQDFDIIPQVRENVDSYHSKYFETVSKMCMWCGLHHQCPGHVVVSVTEQAYQHLIPMNTLEELSQFQFWTILFLSLTSGLIHIKKKGFQGLYLVPSVLVTDILQLCPVWWWKCGSYML